MGKLIDNRNKCPLGREKCMTSKRRRWMSTFLLLSISLIFTACTGITSLTVQQSYRSVAAKTLPVVVQVNTVDILSQEVPEVDGWDFFFPDPDGETPSEERQFRTQGLGSGVIVEREDHLYYVITNNHVVGEADEVSVTLHDGRIFPAELIGKDERRDLALLSFSAPESELPTVRYGDSDTLRQGDLVVAVGNPFGYSGTVTSGVISGLHRSGPTDISDFIQTDAAINQGNSGGALVDLQGRLVGINTWITTPTGGSIGLGFAIPVNSVRVVIRQLIDNGEVAYGWLGVSIADALPDLVASLGEETSAGAIVTNVYLDSPAFAAGIRPGDIILQIGRKSINNADNLIQAVSDLLVSSENSFIILRDGEEIELTVTIAERNSDDAIRSRSELFWPGLRLYPLTDYILQDLEISAENGIVVLGVDRGTPAENAGFESGDIITALDGERILSLDDFYRGLNRDDSTASDVTVVREGEELKLTLGPAVVD